MGVEQDTPRPDGINCSHQTDWGGGTYTLSHPLSQKIKKPKPKNRNVYPPLSAHSLLHHRPSLLYCEQVLALAALMCLLGNLGLWGSLWFSTSAQRTQCTSSCRLLSGHFHLGQDVPQAKTEPGFFFPPTLSMCHPKVLTPSTRHTQDKQNTVKKQSSKSHQCGDIHFILLFYYILIIIIIFVQVQAAFEQMNEHNTVW